VLAVFRPLWHVAQDLPRDPAARNFVPRRAHRLLPAAVIGALLHGFIKGVLFNRWSSAFR
jgi:undecaprenyl-diphosphatase